MRRGGMTGFWFGLMFPTDPLRWLINPLGNPAAAATVTGGVGDSDPEDPDAGPGTGEGSGE